MRNAEVQRWFLPTVAALLSGAMLAYEILLTRIASVLYVSQYVFLVIGFALLGISGGAILEYRRKNFVSAEVRNPALWLTWTSLTLAAAIVVILLLGARSGMTFLVLAATVPFVVSGYFLSKLFRLAAERSGLLYAADLTGAAIGALIVPVLLPAFGPAQSILLLSAVIAAAGFLLQLASNQPRKFLTAGAVLILSAGLWGLNTDNRLFGDVPVGRDPNKDLYRLTALEGDAASVVDSRWSTFGRTDLVQFRSDSSMMTIFIDGAAGANMLRFSGLFDNFSANFTHAVHEFGGIYPLLNLNENQKDNALIIGPGGGRDILLALRAGFKKITAVEVNPQVVTIGREYRDYNGGIFDDNDNIKVVLGEGRDFLRNSREHYDLITLFMPITKSSRSLNAFALSESYLFTKEAFEDYRSHLTDEGRLLVMAHGMEEVLKIMTTAVESMKDEGLNVQEAMSRVYVLGSEMMPLFGMQKSPLQTKESEFLHLVAHRSMFNCEYSYIPGVEQQLIKPPMAQTVEAGIPMMNPFFLKLASGSYGLDRLERGSGFNFIPARDDSPFFLRFDFGLPSVVTSMSLISAMVIGLLLIPAVRFRKDTIAGVNGFTWWLPMFFVFVGIGYVVIEVSLFQKLVFFLGDPSRSLALLLAALLAGSGIGSYFSRRADVKAIVRAGIAVALLNVLLVIIIPGAFTLFAGQSVLVKQIVAALFMVAVGVPMGILFPTALRITKTRLGATGIPWAWSLNGAASVLGSALAVAVALEYGISWSLILGAASYALASLSALMMTRSTGSSGPIGTAA